MARTERRFTFQRRLVTLWAWLMLFPNCGPLPQTSHTRAILQTPDSADFKRQQGGKSQDSSGSQLRRSGQRSRRVQSQAPKFDCNGTRQNHAIGEGTRSVSTGDGSGRVNGSVATKLAWLSDPVESHQRRADRREVTQSHEGICDRSKQDYLAVVATH